MQVPDSPGQWCGIEHTLRKWTHQGQQPPKLLLRRAAGWSTHPTPAPFSLPWLCDPRDAHLSPSSRRKSCLVGANEVAPSRWPGADSVISLWPNSAEWNMRGSGLGRLLRKVFCAWRSKCFRGWGGGEPFICPQVKPIKKEGSWILDDTADHQLYYTRRCPSSGIFAV